MKLAAQLVCQYTYHSFAAEHKNGPLLDGMLTVDLTGHLLFHHFECNVLQCTGHTAHIYYATGLFEFSNRFHFAAQYKHLWVNREKCPVRAVR